MAKMRRFVCALLPVMLLVSSFAVHAETDKGSIPMGSLDINNYSSLLEQAMNLYNKQIMEKYYQEVIAKKTASEHSELLMGWYEAGEMSLYMPNEYQDCKVDVVVIAESVQAKKLRYWKQTVGLPKTNIMI